MTTDFPRTKVKDHVIKVSQEEPVQELGDSD